MADHQFQRLLYLLDTFLGDEGLLISVGEESLTSINDIFVQPWCRMYKDFQGISLPTPTV